MAIRNCVDWDAFPHRLVKTDGDGGNKALACKALDYLIAEHGSIVKNVHSGKDINLEELKQRISVWTYLISFLLIKAQFVPSLLMIYFSISTVYRHFTTSILKFQEYLIFLLFIIYL